MDKVPKIPSAPKSIQKGSSLADILDRKAVSYLANNLLLATPDFKKKSFVKEAMLGIDDLGIMERGHHLSKALRNHLPDKYEEAIEVLLNSLTPPNKKTSDLGLAVFFYLPHVSFVVNYGIDKHFNGGEDPFEISMRAQYELTKRFSAEFSIRYFLKKWEKKTLKRLLKWTKDKDPHVRRLCSEGTRPRLPWAIRLPSFIDDPSPVLPILEKLKDDPELYVRRSVANHLGDIAKDHPELVFNLCNVWLKDASKERKWVIRHALRYPAKKGNRKALMIRKMAKD